MNASQHYLDAAHPHITTGPSYAPHSQTSSGAMSHYSHYAPQTAQLSSAGSAYAPAAQSYQYYSSATSPPTANPAGAASMSAQLLPSMMSMGHAGHPQHQYAPPAAHAAAYASQPYDSSGQCAPTGAAAPRVTATLWEDEGSLCFQVEARGVCVARREDNHFINGTKLLNVAGMTRGRRDGILKSEKVRHVVKIGPMHLKGVWIPFDRALEFANREKITDSLYPLFVHNISNLISTTTHSSRASMLMDPKRRALPDKMPSNNLLATPGGPASSVQQSMSGQLPAHVSQSAHAMHAQTGRPMLDRAHTFPTPPTSASSVIATQGSTYDWNNQHMASSVPHGQPLAIDTGLSNARSLPATPASTPPGSSIHHQLPSYANQQSYDAARPMYAAAAQQPATSQYASQHQQPGLPRYTQTMQSNPYLKSEMAPPSRVVATGSGNDGDHAELKPDPYGRGTGAEGIAAHSAGDDEAEHEHDGEYSHDNTGPAYSTGRGPAYGYAGASMTGLPSEHPHLPSDHVNDSPHQASGRVTPRTSVSQPAWAPGYNTPPRSDTYSSSGYPSGPMQGGTSNKRAREDDDGDYKGRGGEDVESIKRLKSSHEGTTMGPGSGYDAQGQPVNRSRSNILQHTIASH